MSQREEEDPSLDLQLLAEAVRSEVLENTLSAVVCVDLVLVLFLSLFPISQHWPTSQTRRRHQGLSARGVHK